MMAKLFNTEKSKFDNSEPHFASQTINLAGVEVDDVDYLVHIKDLTPFMKNIIKVEHVVTYNASTEKLLSIEDFTHGQITRIRQTYDADYHLLEKYKDKIYSP
jgi:hypothetical protein